MIKLHPKQFEVYRNSSRFRVVCAGRRFGKTRLSLTELIREARYPNRKVWYVAPSYRMAKQIMWYDLIDAIPRKWIVKLNETTMTVWLINGSTIELKGADKPDCYDEETEILTYEGWTKFSTLPEGMPVLTLNPQTLKAEWQVPTRYIDQPYSGPMYRVASKKIDLLVTPNHRFFVESRKGKRKFKTISELAYNDAIPASTGWEGEDRGVYSHDLLAFIGLYLAEGCARKNPGPKNSYEITFAQTPGLKGGLKRDVRAEFIEILNRLGVSYVEYDSTIKVYSKELWQEVARLGRAWEKRIPTEILNLPPEKLKTLFIWMLNGDGLVRQRDIRYYTTSKSLAGDVQELCFKIGLSANVEIKQQKPSTLKDGRIITPKHSLYEVCVYRNSKVYFRDTGGSYISEVDYNGRVYCVEVPNHIVMVRRNGKATWCGNSLRGVGLHFVVLDEVQDMRDEVWTKVLRPTLATTRGRALFIGTPKTKSTIFYKLWEMGQREELRKKGSWHSWQFRTIDSPFVPPDEVEQARADLDEKSFRQEFEASWETMSGLVYYAFDRNVHVGDYSFNPKLPVWIGQDFNIDPMSSVVMQLQPDGSVWAVDEIYLASSNVEEVCDEIERRYWRHMKSMVIYPDPAARSKQHARGESSLDIFREKGFKKLKYRRYHPAVVDRINSVNRMLRAGNGDVKLRIDRRCRHLIESFEKTMYVPGTPDIDKKPGYEHMTDALGYCIDYEFPLRKIEIAGLSV